MKIEPHPLLTLGAALLLAPLTPTSAQSSWEIVDALAPWRGRDIVADTAGNFVGIAIDNSTSSSGPVSTAVSLSADQGLTWQTVGSIPGYAIDLAVAPDGALFASGNRSATVSGRAFCWQSLDDGATWTASDPSAGLSTAMLVTDVAAGNSDAIYLCGTLSGKWIVRKGQRVAGGGIAWATVDNPALSAPTTVFVRPGPAGQPDEVLVCGGGWMVRRSTDGGSTWSAVANPTGTYASQSATALAVGTDGAILVSGRTSKTVGSKKTGYTTEYGWLTRRSANGGATWTDVDYVVNGQPANMAVDGLGRVLAVGCLSSTPLTWLVRGSTDGGATWVTTDVYLPAGTPRSMAWGVAGDPFGNVCVMGETGDTASTYTALIRRLAAP
ncbi:MAG: glycoside hydrolase [Verrucomicrobia bacterium]|nr:glycoside hydrolase [Verrucomicrobiota bacterium]